MIVTGISASKSFFANVTQVVLLSSIIVSFSLIKCENAQSAISCFSFKSKVWRMRIGSPLSSSDERQAPPCILFIFQIFQIPPYRFFAAVQFFAHFGNEDRTGLQNFGFYYFFSFKSKHISIIPHITIQINKIGANLRAIFFDKSGIYRITSLFFDKKQ